MWEKWAQKQSLHKSCLAAKLAHGSGCADKIKTEVGILGAVLWLNRSVYRQKYPLGLHPPGRDIAVFFPLSLMEVKRLNPANVPPYFCPTKPSCTSPPGTASAARVVRRRQVVVVVMLRVTCGVCSAADEMLILNFPISLSQTYATRCCQPAAGCTVQGEWMLRRALPDTSPTPQAADLPSFASWEGRSRCG